MHESGTNHPIAVQEVRCDVSPLFEVIFGGVLISWPRRCVPVCTNDHVSQFANTLLTLIGFQLLVPVVPVAENGPPSTPVLSLHLDRKIGRGRVISVVQQIHRLMCGFPKKPSFQRISWLGSALGDCHIRILGTVPVVRLPGSFMAYASGGVVP